MQQEKTNDQETQLIRYQSVFKKFQDDVLKIRESHAENRAKWNDFLTLDGTNTVERVRTQIDRITQQNNFLELQLSDISGLIHQFIELNELVKKPEVAVDYRDLDYAN